MVIGDGRRGKAGTKNWWRGRGRGACVTGAVRGSGYAGGALEPGVGRKGGGRDRRAGRAKSEALVFYFRHTRPFPRLPPLHPRAPFPPRTSPVRAHARSSHQGPPPTHIAPMRSLVKRAAAAVATAAALATRGTASAEPAAAAAAAAAGAADPWYYHGLDGPRFATLNTSAAYETRRVEGTTWVATTVTDASLMTALNTGEGRVGGGWGEQGRGRSTRSPFSAPPRASTTHPPPPRFCAVRLTLGPRPIPLPLVPPPQASESCSNTYRGPTLPRPRSP